MVMNAMRKGAAGGIVKFVLFGLLAMATAGMIFMDMGGFFRGGGLRNNDVAKVGSQSISIQQFDRMARRALQRVGMTPEQAYKMGYMQEMLNGEISQRLLASTAHDLGVSINVHQVAQKLNSMLAPMAAPGQDPKDVLAQILQSQGMSEAEMVHSLRTEMEVGLIGAAIQSGFAESSDNLVNDLAQYEKEKRSVEFIAFLDKDYTETKKPDDAALQQMYEATKEAYANPELREGQIIILNTKNIQDKIEITEDDLRDVYDRNISTYTEPESRTVERALLADADQAAKVAESVKGGKSLKNAVKDITGNTTDYIAPEKLTEKMAEDDLKAEIFSAKEGDVIGPIESPLGQTILVVNKINEEKVQNFDAVKGEIKKELLDTKLADAQFDLANELDDALASGSDIDEIKNQFDVEVKNLTPMSTTGADKTGKPALGDIKDIGDKVLRALYELNEGEASAIFDMPDGRMAAVMLKTITPKSYKPFEELKDQLSKQWMDSARTSENKLQALKLLAEMQTEGQGLKDIAGKYKKQVQNKSGILKTKAPEAPLNAASLGSIFEAKEGELIALDIEGGAAIAKVTKVDISGTYSKEEMDKARPNIVKSLQNESYQLTMERARKKHGTQINDALLEQAYGAKDE